MLERARDYDDAEWSAVIARLAERGLLTPDGALTRAGRALKQDIEDRTDALALGAYDALDDAEIERLIERSPRSPGPSSPAGDIPAATPMGPTLS